MAFVSEKEKYGSMPLAEKRKHYKAAAVTVDKISTWPDHWSKNKDRIERTAEKSEKVPKQIASLVSVWNGDITTLEIDAIVNAANSSLRAGGGVDGSIHRAAGPYLQQECLHLGGCPVGEAKVTGGYKLPAKYVVQTVGPMGEVPEKLKLCYENSLKLTKEYNIRTIAFPCISTGIYGYPQKAAADVALSTVKKFLLANPESIKRVIFCCFLQTDYKIYEELLQKYYDFQ